MFEMPSLKKGRIIAAAGLCLAAMALAPSCSQVHHGEQDKPNVIFVLTDDQGYGDLSVHGNPVLKTPSLDALYHESLRFTDFHVAPMCTPTRGELLTGIDAFRNGATAVCEGRSLPRQELPMMAQFFRESGYATGHFGKWHLGDNYPYRPQDRGFDETIHNQAWGIKSLAEHPGNDTRDDIYWHNGELEQFEGYNTDVFFREAMNWIDQVHQQGPFFAFIPTTAAHSPYWVDARLAEPYDSLRRPIPEFFGMISNIDTNMDRLDSFLESRGLSENTILIFMTDNGTAVGHHVFNAGMRGFKRSEYDGGHRVPFFFRWPAKGYNEGRDIDALTHSTDLLPTLIELCGLKQKGDKYTFDGQSLTPLLEGNEDVLDDRMVVVQYDARFVKWKGAVLWKKWRLVNGTELYDVESDPGQQHNLYEQKTEVAQKMRAYYENWVRETEAVMEQENVIPIGTPQEPIAWLSSCNWTGSYADNWGNLADVDGQKFGHWLLKPVRSGVYEVSLYLFHPALATPLNQGYDGFAMVPARPVAKAELLINNKSHSIDTGPNDTHATFIISLEHSERIKLEGRFLDKNGKALCGAFYTFVQKVNDLQEIPTVSEYVKAH